MPHNPYSLSDWLGYMTYPEIDFLTRLAKSLPEQAYMINIGAGGGTSGLILRSNCPNGYLCTLDKQMDSSPFGCIEAELLVLRENNLLDYAHYGNIVGDSKESLAHWTGPAVDMVFVDGDHAYESAKGDALGALKILKPGGIIAFHDYGDVGNWSGVQQAVDELMLGKYEQIDLVNHLIAFRNTPLKKSRTREAKR